MANYETALWKAVHHHFNSVRVQDAQGMHIALHKVCSYCTTYKVELPIETYFRMGWNNLSHTEKNELTITRDAEEEEIATATILPHLLTEHGFAICTKCDSLIKRTGMSAHKKSYSCEEANRKRIMNGRGMRNATMLVSAYLDAMTFLARELKKGANWEDYAIRDFVDDELVVAKRKFLETTGIVRVLTSYVNAEGWQEEAWAPEEVHSFMELLAIAHKYPSEGYLLERNREMWAFLEADEDQRACAFGMFELSLDRV